MWFRLFWKESPSFVISSRMERKEWNSWDVTFSWDEKNENDFFYLKYSFSFFSSRLFYRLLTKWYKHKCTPYRISYKVYVDLFSSLLSSNNFFRIDTYDLDEYFTYMKNRRTWSFVIFTLCIVPKYNGIMDGRVENWMRMTYFKISLLLLFLFRFHYGILSLSSPSSLYNTLESSAKSKALTIQKLRFAFIRRRKSESGRKFKIDQI